jgi:hypothetical protein
LEFGWELTIVSKIGAVQVLSDKISGLRHSEFALVVEPFVPVKEGARLDPWILSASFG